ncbi:TPA: ATP-grasp fold amidoligase family protein, partial [Enterococcus faecium]
KILCRTFPIIMTKYFYRKILGRKLKLKKPETFNEKINWYKLYFCPQNDLVIQCTDKFRVREYVEDMYCGDSLNDLIGVWDGVDEINWNSLPQRFVLKCNHGCGMNIICPDKTSLDIEETKNRLNKWMKMDWGKESIEPHYSKIKPKIICEKFIENTLDKESSLPPDIKIHCFNGIPKVIAYYSGRGNDMHGTFYDVNWNKLDFATKEGSVISKPICLDKMLLYAEKLSNPFPYVRVDFYECNNIPVFGELTFTPASGRSPYMTREADEYMGNLLNLKEME